MEWSRLEGSLKLWVSFAEYSLFSWALWHKRPIILRSLPIVATPYQVCVCTRLSKACMCACVHVCGGGTTWGKWEGYRVAKRHGMPYLCWSFCRKALLSVSLLRKETCNFRHRMRLRHPLWDVECVDSVCVVLLGWDVKWMCMGWDVKRM